MNSRDLYNAIGKVDDDILEKSEADAGMSKTKHRRLKLAVIAASLCLVITGVFIWKQSTERTVIEKMDDAMMDKLEPYNYGNLQDFKTPYLSGYLAEKYNYTDEELFPRVEKRAYQYCMAYARSTMTNYSSVSIHHQNIQIRPEHAYYTLLPVWMFCYDYEHAEHNFMMNGQTGKIVGKPPISYQKVIGWFAGISILTFIILKVIMFFIGGVWI